jgi:CIC family chloride channel protein
MGPRRIGRYLRSRTSVPRDEMRRLVRQSREVLVLAAVVGALTGLGVAAFDGIVTSALDQLGDAPLWLVAILPTFGLLLAGALLSIPRVPTTQATTDEYIQAYHDRTRVLGARAALARITAGIATLASGVPMGLEGPSLYLGATVGDVLERRVPRVFAARRVLLVAGAAAGVAAIFKAPATGAVFALEVPYQEDFGRRALAPALVASVAGYLVFIAFHGTAPLLAVRGEPPFSFKDLAGAVLLGVGAGLGARLFAAALRVAKGLTTVAPAWARAIGAGAVLAGFFVCARALTGESPTTGTGYNTIHWALEPDRGLWILAAVLLLRCLGTSIALAGGGVGGLFVPLVVAGALTGRLVAGAVDALETSLFTLIGVAAFLGAGYRVPLAAITFVAEATGRPGFIVPGVIAAVVADVMMGRSSVTAYQRPAVVAPSE